MKIDKQKAIVLLTPVVKTMLKNEIIISNIYDANHAKEFASNVVDYMEDMEDTIDESKSKRIKLKSLLKENDGRDSSIMDASSLASHLLSLLAAPDFKKYLERLGEELDPAQISPIKRLYDALYKELKKYDV